MNPKSLDKTKECKNEINWDIDVRYEEDVLKAFDKFITKWCGNNSAHLLDSDEQDGQFMRDKIEKLLTPTQSFDNKLPEKIGYVCGHGEKPEDCKICSAPDNKLPEVPEKIKGIPVEVCGMKGEEMSAEARKINELIDCYKSLANSLTKLLEGRNE
jgi:hypothetical protein